MEERYGIKKLNQRLVEIYEALLAGWQQQPDIVNPVLIEWG